MVNVTVWKDSDRVVKVVWTGRWLWCQWTMGAGVNGDMSSERVEADGEGTKPLA